MLLNREQRSQVLAFAGCSPLGPSARSCIISKGISLLWVFALCFFVCFVLAFDDMVCGFSLSSGLGSLGSGPKVAVHSLVTWGSWIVTERAGRIVSEPPSCFGLVISVLCLS